LQAIHLGSNLHKPNAHPRRPHHVSSQPHSAPGLCRATMFFL
jgi:hypothetical protein